MNGAAPTIVPGTRARAEASPAATVRASDSWIYDEYGANDLVFAVSGSGFGTDEVATGAIAKYNPHLFAALAGTEFTYQGSPGWGAPVGARLRIERVQDGQPIVVDPAAGADAPALDRLSWHQLAGIEGLAGPIRDAVMGADILLPAGERKLDSGWQVDAVTADHVQLRRAPDADVMSFEQTLEVPTAQFLRDNPHVAASQTADPLFGRDRSVPEVIDRIWVRDRSMAPSTWRLFQPDRPGFPTVGAWDAAYDVAAGAAAIDSAIRDATDGAHQLGISSLRLTGGSLDHLNNGRAEQVPDRVPHIWLGAASEPSIQPTSGGSVALHEFGHVVAGELTGVKRLKAHREAASMSEAFADMLAVIAQNRLGIEDPWSIRGLRNLADLPDLAKSSDDPLDFKTHDQGQRLSGALHRGVVRGVPMQAVERLVVNTLLDPELVAKPAYYEEPDLTWATTLRSMQRQATLLLDPTHADIILEELEGSGLDSSPYARADAADATAMSGSVQEG